MLMPIPGRTAADLVRIIGRRLNGLRFVTASGAGAAYARIVVYMDETGAQALEEQYGCLLLEREFSAAYVALARRAGWRMPKEPVEVEIAVDERLEQGRLFLVGRPGPLAEPGDGRRGAGGTVPMGELDTELATMLATIASDETVSAARADGRATVLVGPALKVSVAGREQLLDVSGRHLLGRDAASAVALTDAAVSRRHAELWFAGGTWRLRDVGSSNGTRVGGHAIGSRAVLIDGPRSVQLGGCALRLEPVGDACGQPAR
jgi:hypothetical protein